MVIKIAVNDKSEIKKERKKEYNRRYREENKEKIKELKKRYYEENSEKCKEYSRCYNKSHREERKEYNRRYIQEHRSEINKRRRGEAPVKAVNSLIKPVGSERLNERGYTIVKVNENNKWRLKHHLIYEDYYGEKVGRWDKIIFLDGDKQNLNPENLVKISAKEQMYLGETKMLCSDTELNRVSVTLAKLIVTAKKKGKNKL